MRNKSVFSILALLSVVLCASPTLAKKPKKNGAQAPTSTSAASTASQAPQATPSPQEPSVAPGPGCRATSVSVGEAHMCVVVNGKVKCAGSNRNGQIGNGSGGSTDGTPLTEVKLSGATSVSAGVANTCAIVEGGQVKCWGANVMFHSDDAYVATPTAIPGLSGAKKIGTGIDACAILASGQVKCWGEWEWNGKAVDVSGLATGVNSIAMSRLDGCAVVDGAARCGRVRSGVRDVPGVTSGVTSVGSGISHSCAVVNGGVKCWGTNEFGQLGTGGTTQVGAPPTDVPGLTSGVRSVYVGGNVSCAVMTNGGAKCWGENGHGTIGMGETSFAVTKPKDVIGLSKDVVSMSISVDSDGGQACALLSNGKVKCWGRGDSGQMGTGGTDDVLSPTELNLCP